MDKVNSEWLIKSKSHKDKSKFSVKDIVKILLENRGLKTEKTKSEFLSPKLPAKITLKNAGIKEKAVTKALVRLKKAKTKKEKIIIYGDYDTDGVCSTAILWERLFKLGFDVIPYIPDRFEEGYGINPKSVKKLIAENPILRLIITVDNGIVANEAVAEAKLSGVDVIITDHHQKEKKLPKAFSIIHTDKLSGSGIAWMFSERINEVFGMPDTSSALELAAIGTISDQLQLVGINRSIAKFGLEELNKTDRVGLLALFEESGITKGNIGTYEVNYLISPRINAMGRLKHAVDSLRLLCTKNAGKARSLATIVGQTNKERQKEVEKMIMHTKEAAAKVERGPIVIAHTSYHEGIIGLAASKLVDEYYRPTIVISQGTKYSKASARSISGFNIIENIRKLDTLLVGGGGHPMAAGFTIETPKISEFINNFSRIVTPLLSDELLTRKLKLDMEIGFDNITDQLASTLLVFEPTGVGNPTPSFVSRNVDVIDVRGVGDGGKHLKLTLVQNKRTISGIGFGLGNIFPDLINGSLVDIAYTIDKNIWKGVESIQLKIKEIKLH